MNDSTPILTRPRRRAGRTGCAVEVTLSVIGGLWKPVILFHLLDPSEISPDIKQSTLFEDMETGHAIEVSPTFMQKEYRERINAHIAAIQKAASGMNCDHVLINTADPLDRALHSYLTFREKRG